MEFDSISIETTQGFSCPSGVEDGEVILDPESSGWHHPSTKDVFEEVGLFSIEHYIKVRRQTIANYIVHRPIFSMCTGAERLQGSSPCQF